MSKKKKTEPERQPDLHAGGDQQELEERVAQLMEPESKAAKEPEAKQTEPADGADPASAPELPGKKQIKVTSPDEPAADNELAAAIAAANDQLKDQAQAGPSSAPLLESESEKPDEAKEASGKTPETDKAAEEAATPEALESLETLETPEVPAEPETSPAASDGESAEAAPVTSPLDETLTDPSTAKAVSDIAAKNSDDLLASEDEKLATAFVPPPKLSFKERLKSLWAKKAVRRGVLIFGILLVLTLAVVPASRYFMLNTVGVRGSASLTVFDASTRQPLRNVNVKLAGADVKTDENGTAKLERLKLGKTKLVIERRAFAPVERSVTVGWGSNPLGDFNINPVGAQYAFMTTDFLSGQPVHKAEAISGEASAFSDEAGKLLLTIDETEADTIDVQIVREGYREETIKLDLSSKETVPVQMVAGRKHVFVTKRSGRYDVYKIDADGQNETLVLPGTGSERDDMVLVPHPDKELAALVSTRDNKRNDDGFLLSTLTILDLDNGSNREIVTSERVQVVGWVDGRLVYVQVAAGSSTANPKRHRLMSYDYDGNENKELAAGNYFNAVTAANGRIYYAPASAYAEPDQVRLRSVKADGSNSQTVINQEVWNMFRMSYDKLTLALQRDWYEYNLDGSSSPGKISEPANYRSRTYVDSMDGTRSLWVDNRDGKGVLLVYDKDSGEDKVAHNQSGLKYPVRWLNHNTVVFRISTPAETAEYALNLDGGEPKKIRDVTDTGSVDNWYYY